MLAWIKFLFVFAPCFFFCKFCFDGGNGPCDNEAYVAPFNLAWLKIYNANDAHENVEFVFQLEIDQEALVVIIEVGDHFAIVVEEGNSGGTHFWIFICEESLHAIEEEMKGDNWGQVVFQGE
jgi:Zn/Cd-binding protein ZinT